MMPPIELIEDLVTEVREVETRGYNRGYDNGVAAMMTMLAMVGEKSPEVRMLYATIKTAADELKDEKHKS